MVLGCNVFGWTADKETSFKLLDTFVEAGFNAIDTADWYNKFLPGGAGGESETLIGEWMKDRRARDKIVILTKVGLPMGEGLEGLSRNYLPGACDRALKRLQTDYIDVYKAHRSDPNTPIEETLETFQSLIDAGKVRYVGGSNYKPEELEEALKAAGPGRARYDVFEPHYNLADRHMFEGAPEDICVRYGVGVVTYYSLASGFLTGKYRNPNDMEGSKRTRMVSQNLNERGLKLLDVVDTVAARHNATPAQISLAWLLARPSVTAPVASATKIPQLQEILKAATIKLTAEDMKVLDAASAPAPAAA
jgi:aryl-alcohol dehydrogenase-like predicted oxidoreductase